VYGVCGVCVVFCVCGVFLKGPQQEPNLFALMGWWDEVGRPMSQRQWMEARKMVGRCVWAGPAADSFQSRCAK